MSLDYVNPYLGYQATDLPARQLTSVSAEGLRTGAAHDLNAPGDLRP